MSPIVNLYIVQILGICFAQNLRADIFAQVFYYPYEHYTSLIYFLPDGQVGMTEADPRDCLVEADLTMRLRDHSIANQIQHHETTITKHPAFYERVPRSEC